MCVTLGGFITSSSTCQSAKRLIQYVHIIQSVEKPNSMVHIISKSILVSYQRCITKLLFQNNVQLAAITLDKCDGDSKIVSEHMVGFGLVWVVKLTSI